MTIEQIIAALQKLPPELQKAEAKFYDSRADTFVTITVIEPGKVKDVAVVTFGELAVTAKIAVARARRETELQCAKRRHSPDSLYGRIFGD